MDMHTDQRFETVPYMLMTYYECNHQEWSIPWVPGTVDRSVERSTTDLTIAMGSPVMIDVIPTIEGSFERERSSDTCPRRMKCVLLTDGRA